MKIFYSFLFIIYINLAFSQTIDNSFNSDYNGPFEEYIGDECLFTENGKYLTLTKNHDDYEFNNITRRNSDGSIDETFTPLVSQGASILFNGPNNNFGSYSYNNTFRFYNSEGTLLSAIQLNITSQISSDGYIWDYIWQSDNKILVVGDFSTINGYSRKNIARFNLDGSIDNTFNPIGANGQIMCVERQSDGKYVIGGDFSTFNNLSKNKVARINFDGSLDSTFIGFSTTQTGPVSTVRNLKLQQNGSIIIGGTNFRSNSTIVSYSLTRLLSNGTRDTSFTCNLNILNPTKDFLILPNGKLLVYGQGNSSNFLTRLNSNGSSDTSFQYSNTIFYVPNTELQNLPDDKVLICSNYLSQNGINRKGIHRIDQNGLIDLTFNPQQSNSNQINSLKVLQNGKILMIGESTSYNDTPCSKFAFRVNENGSLDNTFNLDPRIEMYGEFIMKEQSDGKIIIIRKDYSGTLKLINETGTGYQEKEILRMNTDGSYDNSFNVNINNLYFITSVEILEEDKILLSYSYNSPNQIKITRLLNNGSVESEIETYNFNANPMFFKTKDGTVFMKVRNSNPNNPYYILKKLDSNGTDTNSFNLYADYIKNIVKQSDGKYLVDYFNFNSNQYNVKRVFENGEIDASFSEISITSNNDDEIKFFINSENKIFISYGNYVPTDDNVQNFFDVYDESGLYLNSYSNNLIGRKFQQGCDNLINARLGDNVVHDLKRITIFEGVTTPSPTGDNIQPYFSNYTLANLIVQGENIQWYSSQSQCALNSQNRLDTNSDIALPLSTPLTDGVTYYASQTLNGIESNYRLAVTVNSQLGMNDSDKNNFIIINPFNDTLFINSPTEIKEVNIFDLSGKLILNEKCDNCFNIELKTDSITKGIYLVKIETSNKTYISKVIK